MKNVSNKEKIINISIWQSVVRDNLAKNRLQRTANANITHAAKVVVDGHKRQLHSESQQQQQQNGNKDRFPFTVLGRHEEIL